MRSRGRLFGNRIPIHVEHMVNTTVRCFRRKDKGTLRRGIWAMTGGVDSCRGMFIHGNCAEIQGPDYTMAELIRAGTEGGALLDIEEITPEEALAEVANWPAGQDELRAAFARHPKVVQ